MGDFIPITHAPLFTGINGFGFAGDMLGWLQPFHCEIDEFCQKIIQYYWEKSKAYYDITKTDFTFWRGRIDVLSGGFPCQPFSNAGKRGGVDDNRYLWPEYLRAIRESKPIAVVGENVTGLFTMEQHEMFARVDSRRIVRFENYDEYEAVYTRQATMLVNDICRDLEEAGYAVQPFVVPAAGVGAPHRRDRVWFVAYANGPIKEYGQRKDIAEKGEVWWKEEGYVSGKLHGSGIVANPSERIGKESHKRHTAGMGREREQVQGNCFRDFPTQHPICSGNDGISTQLDGITFSKWRKESLKGYGNAVVPQVVYPFFKAIGERINASRA